MRSPDVAGIYSALAQLSHGERAHAYRHRAHTARVARAMCNGGRWSTFRASYRTAKPAARACRDWRTQPRNELGQFDKFPEAS